MFDMHVVVANVKGMANFGDTTVICACLLEFYCSTPVSETWQRARIVYKPKVMLSVVSYVLGKMQ